MKETLTMADMDVDLYDALKQGGVPEEQARAAAISLSEKIHLLTEEIHSLKDEQVIARSAMAGNWAFIRAFCITVLAAAMATGLGLLVNYLV